MSVGEDMCRLCLRVPHNNFVLIDETAREMLDVLFVKMNFDISNDPLMCEDCAQIVKRSLSFISVCMDSEEMILSFNTGEDKTNIDLRDVYSHMSKESIERDSIICRLCIKKVKEKNVIPLGVLMKENMFLDTLKEYISQMDLNIIKNPLICFHCQDNMESYSKFLQNCCNVEEKVNTYRRNRGIKKGEKIMLSDVFEQFFENGSTYPNRRLKVSKENREEPLGLVGTENTIIGAASLEMNNEAIKIESEEIDIKDEVTVSEGTGRKRKRKRITCICINKSDQHDCVKCRSQFEVSSEGRNLYKCKLCTFEGYCSAFRQHMLKHRDISEVRTFQCPFCERQMKHKNSLNAHLLTHKKFSELQVFKCNICDFRSKFKASTDRHILAHNALQETAVYKCTFCDFRTKHKKSLKKHLLLHDANAIVKTYKCTSCDYESKYYSNFQEHVVMHKDPSKIKLFKCNLCECSFISRTRLSVHKRRKHGTTVYKCELCDYQTKRGDHFARHATIHTNASRRYKCPSCSYKGKTNYALKMHSLTHTKEPPKYQCAECSYATHSIRNLKSHVLVHKSFSQVPTYKCPKKDCKFMAKQRGQVTVHLLTHNTVYKCSQCEFDTCVRHSFNQHKLVHEEEKGVKIHRCECGYGAKFKYVLKIHRRTHRRKGDISL